MIAQWTAFPLYMPSFITTLFSVSRLQALILYLTISLPLIDLKIEFAELYSIQYSIDRIKFLHVKCILFQSSLKYVQLFPRLRLSSYNLARLLYYSLYKSIASLLEEMTT